MNFQQLGVPLGTAVVGFALGLALAPALRSADPAAASEISKPAVDRTPTSSLESADAETPTQRSHAGKRVETNNAKERRISLSLNTVSKILESQYMPSDFDNLHHNIQRVMPLLGATEQESTAILNMLKQTRKDILAEEKKSIQVTQVDEGRIRFDTSGMTAFTNEGAEKCKDAIRATLPQDLAEILIGKINWNEFYPTDEKSFPCLEITRRSSSRLTAWERKGGRVSGFHMDEKFVDDGTPIPADEVFTDERWKPFLKGRTLLPQDEKD